MKFFIIFATCFSFFITWAACALEPKRDDTYYNYVEKSNKYRDAALAYKDTSEQFSQLYFRTRNKAHEAIYERYRDSARSKVNQSLMYLDSARSVASR